MFVRFKHHRLKVGLSKNDRVFGIFNKLYESNDIINNNYIFILVRMIGAYAKHVINSVIFMDGMYTYWMFFLI